MQLASVCTANGCDELPLEQGGCVGATVSNMCVGSVINTLLHIRTAI